MRLAWVRMRGYRRLLTSQTLLVSGKLTALIGPNESGKTSVLDALRSLGTDEPLRALDRTRGAGGSVRTALEAAFFLDAEDREALSDLPGGQDVRFMHVKKSEDGPRTFSLEPDLQRDLSGREELAGRITRVMDHRIVHRHRQRDATFSLGPLKEALRILETDSEDLSSEQLAVLSNASEAFASASLEYGPKYMTTLPTFIREVVQREEEPNPADLATDRLRKRLPEFVLFRDADRDLQSSYELSQIRKKTPDALRNLASTAGLDIKALWAAVRGDDQAEVNTLQTRANRALSEAIQTWTQSGVTVEFRVNGETLLVQIRDEQNRFSGLDERSDGLRQFVALLGFCTHGRLHEPILLIDEVEAHLHYDAQADLIDVLARQHVAKQIIYTTHSLGSLPENLGTGVRLMRVDDADVTKSKIVNRFWGDGQPGFSPLLFGIGATTLAFLPVRAALLVEGPSDHILLPHIFAEVSDRDHLGFQIVPGLASSSRGQIPVLMSHGSRVLYLVDNDKGGDELRGWLEGAGVDGALVFRLAPPNSRWRAVEDVIDDGLLVEAVNAYLDKWAAGDVRLGSGDLPATDRYEALKAWCDRMNCVTPGKVDLAYEIIDRAVERGDGRVLKTGARPVFRRLWRKIESTFEGWAARPLHN